MIWSPYEISIILHYYASRGTFPYWRAPLYQPTIDKFCEAGILVNDGVCISTTEMGNALVRLWCETPLPVQQFVDPRLIGAA